MLCFPSEGRLVKDFIVLKNPSFSAGFELESVGSNGKHAATRLPRATYVILVQFSV
jgi:hypothetical protein